MKGDYSKIPFDERKKMQHYRKVYLQQGKVLLDSDLNENTDLLHYQMKTLTKDGLCGSPNTGFRIGRGVPLLPVDDHRYIIGKEKGWDVENGTLKINYFEKFEGKGSLELENAKNDTVVSFTFQKPVDLSKYRYLRLALNTSGANPVLSLERSDGGNRTTITTQKQEQSTVQNEFSVIEYTFLLDAVLDNITKIFLTGFSSNTTYYIGAMECSPPMFTLEPMTHLEGWSFDTNTAESASISIDGEVIKALQVTRLYKKHFSTVDFSKFETIEFAIKSDSTSAIQFYVSDANKKTSYWDIKIDKSDGLKKYSIKITQKGNELASIEEYGFRELSKDANYHFGSILYGMSLNNNFVIAGAEPLTEESGRLYVDGELYEKEEAETYLNQKDCPSVPSITKGTALVYVDVWQRHVTSAEDPELREVAVGVDTCNRMKAVAQVKVLEGEETSLPYNSTGSGRLSTAVEYMEAEKLCEITPGAEYTGLENRLYRVEIHSPGDVGSAEYKWSRNNASTVSQIVENVKGGTTSVKVKDVRLFEVGDIIEITDDRVEFADRISIKYWGELRKITSIDRNKNELSWEDEGSSDPMNKGMLHDYTAEGMETTHPRVIKWDGTNKTSNEETLKDGITIIFSGSGMLPGDYWTFTARENTRAVELLNNEPPQGVLHHYYPLAIIKWNTNGEIENIEDLRTRFEPLCGLTAADLAFDNTNKSKWKDAENVQQALERSQDPNASGVQFVNKCNFLYGEDVNNVQAALNNLCNGITVPSLTLKGKDKEQSKWPKLECSDSGDISFLTGAEALEERMRISADGKVGIGTEVPIPEIGSDPKRILSIKTQGNGGVEGIGISYPYHGSWGLGIMGTKNSNPGAFTIEHFDVDDHFHTKLLVDKKGNVGIGTPKPDGLLHVSAGKKGDAKLIIEADIDNINEDDQPLIELKQDGGLVKAHFGFDSAKNHLKIRVFEPFKASDIVFYTGSETEQAERMRIRGNGNVGIGTDDGPKSRLHVTGNAGVLNLEGENHTYIQWYPDGYVSGRKAWTGFGNAGSNDFAISNEIDGGDILLLPGKGNVGIGTKKPGAQLEVNGIVKATEFKGEVKGYIPRKHRVPLLQQTFGFETVSVSVGNNPHGIAFDGSHIWVTHPKYYSIIKIDIYSNTRMGYFEYKEVKPEITGIAFDGTYIWLTASNVDSVYKIHRTSGRIMEKIQVGTKPHGIAFDGTHMWVANSGDITLSKIDISSSTEVRPRISAGINPYGSIAFDGTHIWVINENTDAVVKIDISKTKIKVIAVGSKPYGIAFDGTHMWVANSGENTVSKIDINSNTEVWPRISVGSNPQGIAFDGTHIWVANKGENTVSKIDINSSTVVGRISVGNNPQGIAFDGTHIWVANSGENTVSKILKERFR